MNTYPSGLLMDTNVVRSKAPLRLGLAGGGTDISPFSDTHGGCVLNVTINMYASCTLKLPTENSVRFEAADMEAHEELPIQKRYALEGELILHRAVYNRVVKEFCDGKPFPISVTTYCDAPPGSGLGSSSTVVVSMLKAYTEMLKLPLGDYDIAQLAWDVERIDCGLSGGKQDQYAATFGGFNFIEFYKDNRVIVNPLRINRTTVNEFEAHLLIYYTGRSRESANIIDDQKNLIISKNTHALDSMLKVKETALQMKEALLRENISAMSEVLSSSWDAKKLTSSRISNDYIDVLIKEAKQAGAMSAKLSGAGGGGFMFLLVNPAKRLDVERALQKTSSGGQIYRIHTTNKGAEAWTINT